jgi:prepilin-type N-terminal cleavage/methylation domain-containing protein
MPRRRDRAFTLIELLIVIIIIAVMASAVVPAWAKFWARTQFDAMTREVQDVFAYAREQAITNDTPSTVRFDPQSETLTVTITQPPPVTDQPAAFGATDNPAAAQASAEPYVVPLGTDFAIAEFNVNGNNGSGNNLALGGSRGATELQFRGDGTTDGAQITLVGASGYVAHLVVWPGTGRVTVEDR